MMAGFSSDLAGAFDFGRCGACLHGVMRGLDPRIHPASTRRPLLLMDCRVKPGNDDGVADMCRTTTTASRRGRMLRGSPTRASTPDQVRGRLSA
uniref:Uncharacterized protein n=1 Tax=Rhodopseudomonas palustris (strain BisA53) TaxID=316055 RepID=Q07RK5_RHOP5